MIFLGTIVNALAIFVGSVIGALLCGLLSKSKRLSELPEVIMRVCGLCVIYIGLSGVFSGQQSASVTLGDYALLIMIGAIVIGTLIGEALDIDGALIRLGNAIEKKFSHGEGRSGSIAKGFVSATLLFCIGAMAITGAIESGLTQGGSQGTLFAKSVIDMVSSVVFGATFGIGTALSAISVFLYQGLIELVAIFAGKFLSGTVIALMSSTGGLLILSLGLNMVGMTKLKVANMLPSIFLPLIVCFFV